MSPGLWALVKLNLNWMAGGISGVVTLSGLVGCLPDVLRINSAMQTPGISFKRHGFAPQLVSHAVWLYLRFNLSLREVEEMLLERGIDISYETIRRWTAKFGPQIARNLRRRQARAGDVWHLDEVVVKCAGEKFWLWRAVDQHGAVLEEILQKRRDRRAPSACW